MKIERVLAALEEYLSLRRDLGEDHPNAQELQSAKDRAGLALNEYIKNRFDNLLLEERKISSTTPTRKVDVVNPENTKVAWEEVADLLDALNCVPIPMKDLTNQILVHKWMAAYKDWYEHKRKQAMNLSSLSEKDS